LVASFTVNSLRIVFDIDKTGTGIPNSAQIKLYNLSEEHNAIINSPDCYIELTAGYQHQSEKHEDNALIFAGMVASSSSRLVGADMETEIYAIEGRANLRDTYISVSYRNESDGRDIIENIAWQMDIPVRFANMIQKGMVIFKEGYSFVGKARDALTVICRAAKWRWSIQNNVLLIIRQFDTLDDYAGERQTMFVINADSGLIGVPELFIVSATASGGATVNGQYKPRRGYMVEYLMNGRIGINDIVKLETNHFTTQQKGIYRVNKLNIVGDNYGGNWMCKAELIEL
jgi:hypothetical protein